MQLLTPNDISFTNDGRVFRHSRARALTGVVIAAGVAVALVVGGARTHAWLAHYLAGVVVVGLLLARRGVVARFRSTNWLVRLRDDGVLVQFRSHLNHHFPAADRTIVFIPFREVERARRVNEEQELPDTESRNSRQVYVQRRRVVELVLRGDTAPLADALAAEVSRSAPRERTWYGSTGTKYNHYPVTLASPSCLRIEWRVAPSADVFLETLRAHTIVEKPVRRSRDLARLDTLDRDEQDARLRELASSGRIMEAVKIVRRLHGLDLRAARDYVESLLRRREDTRARAS